MEAEQESAYRDVIKETVLHDVHFIKATLSGPSSQPDMPWKRVVIRPVMVRGQKHVQFSYFDAHKDITKNYLGDELIKQIDEALSLGFREIHLQTQERTTEIQITKRGKVFVRNLKNECVQQGLDWSHDRRPNTFLAEPAAVPFLKAIGIVGEHGKIKADMHSKFRQVQEFIKLIDQTGALQNLPTSDLHVVDTGCGNAYLTFAFYYYLNHVLQRAASLVGIDSRGEPLERHRETVAKLGWENLSFKPSSIIDFRPVAKPDIVLALHACDTATDEALAQGIRWNSHLIVSVPCCHHHLQLQLEQRTAPAPFAPVLRNSILKERMGDILTDSFRALILEILGYQTDVVQFVSSEHTAKNLMIRAVKSRQPGNHRFVHEYQDLKAFWGVTPYLEELLADDLAMYLR